MYFRFIKIDINRQSLLLYQLNIPPANFLNENSIDYLVDTVQSKMYGQEIYKEIYEKAAMYMFTVISNHIFQDGNKRTGLEASLLFLKLNDYSLREELVQIQFNKKKIPESGKFPNLVNLQTNYYSTLQ